MKKCLLLAAVLGLIILYAGKVQATTNGLNSTFSIVGVFVPSNSPVMTTNIAGNVVTSIYTTKPLSVNTRSILDILQVEFGASFPTGAHLVYSLQPAGFLVLDSHGNLVLDVSTNAADASYRFVLSNTVFAVAINGKTVATSTTVSTNTVQLVTERAPDYGIYYTDGKSNNFHFTGLVTIHANALMTASNTIYKTESVVLNGSGSGTIFNPADGQYDQAIFTQATWVGSGVNVFQ